MISTQASLWPPTFEVASVTQSSTFHNPLFKVVCLLIHNLFHDKVVFRLLGKIFVIYLLWVLLRNIHVGANTLFACVETEQNCMIQHSSIIEEKVVHTLL